MSELINNTPAVEGKDDEVTFDLKATAKAAGKWVTSHITPEGAEDVGIKIAGTLVNGAARFLKGLIIGTFYGPNPAPKRKKKS